MSNYIFRIHEDGASDTRLECWARSVKLDDNRIRTIKDTVRKGASKVATSVPSPFARMYLFDTAFKMVSEKLEGDSVYHQLVSDCLDMMQLLFNSGHNDKDIRFVQWNRDERLAVLNQKPNGHPHKLLAYSFELFFQGSFSNVQDITLIYYKDILLGGTSPFTLFFTSPNWHREMEENNLFISSTTGDVYFDLDYKPLFQRDSTFIEFLYKFYLCNLSTLNEYCSGLAEYIRNTVEKHRKDLERKSTNEWAFYRNNPVVLQDEYEPIKVIANQSNFLQVCGISIFHLRQTDLKQDIENNSDFVINATHTKYKEQLDSDGRPCNPHKPLVLAKGMNVPGVYLKDSPWIQNTDIRTSSFANGNQLLSERVLPGGSNIQYPFVTTEDFLEDTLIEMPFKLNTGNFFTGYNGDIKCLLPIKKEYFNFFTIEDLKRNLKIIPDNNKIIVKLNIPIRNRKGVNFITFSKEYEKGKTPIAECKAGMAFSPFYRVVDTDESFQRLNDYTVLWADKNSKLSLDALNFYQYDRIVYHDPIPVAKPEPRTKKGITASSNYYKVPSAFDIIELSLAEGPYAFKGIIIPEFKERRNAESTKKFTFAVDFGTSNTHVSFTDMEGGKKVSTFEIGENELQIVLLNKPGESRNVADKYRMGYDGFPDIDAFVNREFIPSIVGSTLGSNIAFPIRTTSCEKATFPSETPSLFGNINIGFFIDSEESRPKDVIYQTSLKWSYENRKDNADPYRIESFLKGLLILIRNKVIMNNGSVKDTKVSWLIPLSMKSRSIELLDTKWKSAFEDVFKGTGASLMEPITESVAPYFYLKNNPDANVKDFADALNIDIGGGTTDVMFFMKKTHKYLSTSFRFAGNDIWGDGFSGFEKNNGFLQNIINYRNKSKQSREKEDNIFDNFMEDSNLKAEDVTSLLFRYDKHFKFTDSIKRDNPELLLVFYLHFSSIIYHIVQIVEKEHVNIPRYITFTGKGSQYINTMCSKEGLTKFTKILLKAYTTLEIPTDFKVILSPNPKEATANGAVLFYNSLDKDRINKDQIVVVYQWGCENGFVEKFRPNVTKIKDVVSNDDFHKSVLINLQAFFDRTLKVERKDENGNLVYHEDTAEIIKFLSEYEIRKIDDYHQFLTNENTQKGGEVYDSYYTLLESLKANQDDGISETFFFFGLKDALYGLSKYIVERNS